MTIFSEQHRFLVLDKAYAYCIDTLGTISEDDIFDDKKPDDDTLLDVRHTHTTLMTK